MIAVAVNEDTCWNLSAHMCVMVQQICARKCEEPQVHYGPGSLAWLQ